MNDPFIEIHDLLRDKRHEDALGKIYDKARGTIKRDFQSDGNHAWYIVGDIFFKQSNYEMAAHSFKKSLESREDDIEACCALANAYSAMNMPDKSVVCLIADLKYKPDSSILNYNLGNAYFDMGDHKKAIRHYERVLPQHEDIYEMAQKNIQRAKKLAS
ncbi:tetratricopeptide repeat protein [Pseudomonas sp. AA-38]|uniref:tetratricopeptide repeat protein n=1 Tax=Pseudomonas sp. AA-38 TaxID=3028807 RepID=UPI0023F7D63D|nr:tetratricopeptide repeat protein [Pseudomonas sp. AA-38]